MAGTAPLEGHGLSRESRIGKGLSCGERRYLDDGAPQHSDCPGRFEILLIALVIVAKPIAGSVLILHQPGRDAVGGCCSERNSGGYAGLGLADALVHAGL